MLTTACAATQNDSAICDGTLEARTDAARGALADGGPMSKRALNVLLDQMAAVCAD